MAFRFSVTTNPQVKDKVEMRENRKHVMHDFLRREGLKTSYPRDARAARPVQPEKRRHLGPSTSTTSEAPKSLNPATPSHLLGPSVLTPQSSCDVTASVRHCDSENENTTMSIAALPTFQIPRAMSLDVTPTPRSQPNVEGAKNPEDESEAEAALPDTNELFSLLNFCVGPYHNFFQATQPGVDLEKLKYDCGRRLRCEAMLTVWLPTLARVEHCFLSTICISAAHDEAMREVAFGAENLHALHRFAVFERLAVKSQTHGMINAILDDPNQRTSDETIVAVVSMLNSEIIGCDLQALQAHQHGLSTMALMRGGLKCLGVQGHLARTLTITMLVNSILREKVADNMYLHYAQEHAAPSKTNGAASRATMFYRGVLEWADLSRFMSPHSPTMALLDLVCQMTGNFRGHEASKARILNRLRDQIWCFEEKTSLPVPTQGDQIYQAVRLTARIYADALSHGAPFSRACRNADLARHCTFDENKPAAFVHIAQCLVNTNLQDFWGGLSGVLFWVALVAGAAAKSSLVEEPYESTKLSRKRQEDAASRLLAAVAVRGSIVFGFEQGSAALGTLCNMLDLQDRLSGRHGSRQRRKMTFGPDGLLRRQSGVCDFAQEFCSADE